MLLKKRIFSISRSLSGGSLMIFLSSELAVAQTSFWVAQSKEYLTSAEICKIQKTVQVLLSSTSSPIPATLKQILKPLNILTTKTSSLAELLFNEGSYARVNERSKFHFRSGRKKIIELGLKYIIGGCDGRVAQQSKSRSQKRSSNLKVAAKNSKTSVTSPKLLANKPDSKTETILELNAGKALIVSIANSSVTDIRTPQSIVSIRASTPTTNSTELPPLEQSGAVVVTHDETNNTTEVAALTNDDITVSDTQSNQTVSLQAGQRVNVRNGNIGDVTEFSLEAAYKNDPILIGLGPGQKHETYLNQAPVGVQYTLKLARARTLEAIEKKNWERRVAEHKRSVLGTGRPGRGGLPRDYDGRDSGDFQSPLKVIPGVFERTGEDTATFTDGLGKVTDIGIDFGDRSISIDGNSGVANEVGLSGNNARGVVNLDNGRQIGIEVFGVNGEEPEIGDRFQGTFTDGIAPDR
ncbi:MAG TPA: hypothetical protein DCF68_00485 [Cyanothece sp. UBA12306]|nr:hypothetical protein [Cyanothece sp. UBA12306]